MAQKEKHSRRGSWTWRHAILKSSLPPTTRHVLLTLSCYMDDVGQSCFPSIELLCESTGLSNRAVIDHLRTAEQSGWIRSSSMGFGDQRWRRKQYKPTWPQGGEAGSPPPDKKAVKEAHDLTQKGGEGGSPPLISEAVNDVHQLPEKVVNVVPKGGERDDKKVVKEVHTIVPSILPQTVPVLSASGDAVTSLLTKKKRKLTGWKLQTFLRFWEAFNFKLGRAEAADAWLDTADLDAALVEKICSAAKIESQRRRDIEARGGTPKWAQGWLSARRWEDEIYQPQKKSPTSTRPNMPTGFDDRAYARRAEEELNQRISKRKAAGAE